MINAKSIDNHIEQLFDVLRRLTGALSRAGIEHRIIGGVATFLHVEERDPMAARLTRDIDIAVNGRDLATIVDAVRPDGLEYKHAAGLDMLVDRVNPTTRSTVHLVFVNEGFRSVPIRTKEGIFLAPVADLVRMKLIGFRLKDRVHIQDMDGVGLITPEVEAQLSVVLQERLKEVRETR